jgi:two-component system, cell cycle sensor histidine kinase and response regulator CckA
MSRENDHPELSQIVSQLQRQIEELKATHSDDDQTEGIIKEQARILDLIFEHSLDNVVLLDKDYNFVRVNETYARACQRDSSEFPGNNHFDFYPSSLKDEFDECKKAKLIYRRVARPFVFPDHPEWGTTYWDLGLVPILDAEGEIELFLFTLRDVTDQKKAEDGMRQAIEFTDTALDAQQDTFFLFDPMSGKAIRWNKAFRDTTGYSDKEIAQMPSPDAYYSSDDLLRAKTFVEDVLQDKVGTIELELICKDGRRVPAEYQVSVIQNEGTDGTVSLVSIGRDITERKKAEQDKAHLEAEYHQAQKEESIGRLAGGIAHDFNNLLTPILGYSEILKSSLASDNVRREMVDHILRSSERARDLVHQLLAFSRKQPLAFKPMDLNLAIHDMEKFLQRTIREDVEISFFPGKDIRPVFADQGQFEQVLINLAVNAADSMPSGGQLTIETSNISMDESLSSMHHDMEPGSYAVLTVRDTGDGIADEVIEHIFEPFYSTKGEQGTGLGLATVYGIVKQHEGHIHVHSDLGSGSTFQVFLPVSDAPSLKEHQHLQQLDHLRGNETVLVAEDNEDVRELAVSILKTQGYLVLDAANGEDALQVLKAHQGSVNLLLTDVVMPGMNGRELLLRAIELFPKLRVLFMSGYFDDNIVQLKPEEEAHNFIQKPFNIHDLTTKVREVLDRGSF